MRLSKNRKDLQVVNSSLQRTNVLSEVLNSQIFEGDLSSFVFLDIFVYFNLQSMSREDWNQEIGCQAPEGPILCSNNCGLIFGSAATRNLCSKCYRDLILRQSNSSAGTKVEATAVQAVTDMFTERTNSQKKQREPEVNSLVTVTNQPVEHHPSSQQTLPLEPSVEQRAPNRCFVCKKRVALTGFKCRCGHIFCALHRYSEKHSCTVDYRATGGDAIAKANPVVKADKVTKI